ncbi:FAD-dependent oxidoreductase [bacterium]|nr:FAD-dependent oxidoreductase [bacterium]
MFRSIRLVLLIVISSFLVFSDCGKKNIPVLRVVDTENNKLIILSGDKTKLHKFYDADFVILGGGLGGIAAALSICYSGRTAILVEETDRIAGCFAYQDTGYFADNGFIETSGSSRTYQKFRSTIKEWYAEKSQSPPDLFRDTYPLLGEFRTNGLCFETEAALDAIDRMLQERIDHGNLTIIKRHKVAKVIRFKDRITSLVAVDLDSLTVTQFTGWMFVDATRTGDLVPLLGLDYSYGRESRAETDEPHAAEIPDSLSAQDVFYYTNTRNSKSHRNVSRCSVIDLQRNPGAADIMVAVVIHKEPRRIKGLKRVFEQDISAQFHEGPRARFFHDSVGIGYQPILIPNANSGSEPLIVQTKPFQIPLGALVTKSCSNYLAGGGNISTSYVAGTAYGSPSVEWAIGEAAGEAAAYCAGLKINTITLATDRKHTHGLQEWLVIKRGAPIYWYDDVAPDDKDFKEAQLRPFRDPDYARTSQTLHYHGE